VDPLEPPLAPLVELEIADKPVGCRLPQRKPRRAKAITACAFLGRGKTYAFLVSFVCLIVMSSCSNFKHSDIQLKDGDRIVFFGDSITERGMLDPYGYINVFAEIMSQLRPDLKLQLIDRGVGGNTVADLLDRVDAGVIAEKPAIVVVYIGINDLWQGEDEPALMTPLDVFKHRLTKLTDHISAGGAKIVLCTPTLIGESKIGTNTLDRKLDEMCGSIRQIASEKGYALCDLRKGFVDYLSSHNPNNVDRGILTLDRVHLSDTGNLLVAKLLLESMGQDSSKLPKF
jgi:lysophospholipase L1-like esterase